MLTIKERLVELDKKIADELDAGRGHPKEECNLQYKIRYCTPVGEAIAKAKEARSALKTEIHMAERELSKKQNELDKLNTSLEAAELTVFTLENLPSPF